MAFAACVLPRLYVDVRSGLHADVACAGDVGGLNGDCLACTNSYGLAAQDGANGVGLAQRVARGLGVLRQPAIAAFDTMCFVHTLRGLSRTEIDIAPGV